MSEIKVSEYAELTNVTVQSVYKLIKNKKIKTTKIENTLYISLNEKEYEDLKKLKQRESLKDEEKEILVSRIESLERENKELRESNKILKDTNHNLVSFVNESNERLKESNILQLKTIEAMKLIENKPLHEDQKKRKKILGIF